MSCQIIGSSLIISASTIHGEKEPVASGIQEIKMENPAVKQGVYTLGGQKVKEQAEDLQDLPQGIYIINGKKVVVK